MPTGFSRTTDCIDLQDVALPYNRASKEIDDTPRIVAGSNVVGHQSGRLSKRPGFPQYLALPAVTGRIDRLLIYATEEDPPKVYVLTSIFEGSTWIVKYIRPDAATPAWTSIGTLRNVNTSTRAHEMVAHKGKVYIKGFPTAGDKYGSVVWDGSGTPTLRIWGLPSPTVPARMNNPAGWAASGHAVTVRLGWKYAYSWETADGHLSNRSPQETNPDNQSSSTGAFTNKKPKVDVQGNSDTTNLPKIVIWRTTDGGGNFLFLDRITNTGAGTITYEDNKRASGLGNEDPKTDWMLDSSNIAPSEVSNDPPPPVNDPKIIGTDNPERSTNVVTHQGRLWYAIRGSLFFSGLEEIFNGLPEHSWPAGFGGNHFEVGERSVAVDVSPEGLIHWTTQHAYVVRGYNRESFAHVPLLRKAGMPNAHPRAHYSYKDATFWITQDFRLVALVNGREVVLSADLSDDITSALSSNREIELVAWAEQDRQYVGVLLLDRSQATDSRFWVYDTFRQAWNPPWYVRLTAVTSGQTRENSEREELIGAVWSGTESALVTMSFTTKRDYVPGTGTIDYAVSLETNLMRVPLGNHMNERRRPVVVPDVVGFVVQRKKFTGDSEPTVSYTLDDWGVAFTTLTAKDPPRKDVKTNLVEKWYHLNQSGQRVALKIEKPAANEDLELQGLAFIYRPEMGV